MTEQLPPCGWCAGVEQPGRCPVCIGSGVLVDDAQQRAGLMAATGWPRETVVAFQARFGQRFTAAAVRRAFLDRCPDPAAYSVAMGAVVPCAPRTRLDAPPPPPAASCGSCRGEGIVAAPDGRLEVCACQGTAPGRAVPIGADMRIAMRPGGGGFTRVLTIQLQVDTMPPAARILEAMNAASAALTRKDGPR